MKQSRQRHRIAVLLAVIILISGLYLTPDTQAKPQRRSSRSARGRSSRSSRGRASRGRGRSSQGGRRGRAVGGRSSRGGRIVAARDRRGRVLRDRRGRIVYERIAPPKPKPGAEIPATRVNEIQHALATQGFFKGEPSGTWDDSTRSAMSSFQSAHNLKPTGLPTAQTLKLLGLTKPTSSPNGASNTESPVTRPRTVTKKP